MLLVIKATFIALLLLSCYLLVPIVLSILTSLLGAAAIVGAVWFILRILQEKPAENFTNQSEDE